MAGAVRQHRKGFNLQELIKNAHIYIEIYLFIKYKLSIFISYLLCKSLCETHMYIAKFSNIKIILLLEWISRL